MQSKSNNRDSSLGCMSLDAGAIKSSLSATQVSCSRDQAVANV